MRLESLEELGDLADETDVERLAIDAVVLGKLMDVIQRLRPIDRDVLLLYLEGLQAAEIADVVGMSSANVAQRIHRARKYLKRHFQKGGNDDEDR